MSWDFLLTCAECLALLAYDTDRRYVIPTDLKYPRDFSWITSNNPFAYSKLTSGYEGRYQIAGQRTDRYEKDLLKRLLRGFLAAHSILEVGCGTGHFTRWIDELGLRAVGLDLSWPMLEQAKNYISPACLQGDALNLPFSSASFDLVALIRTLEFLPDPNQALIEAIRIARQGLILVVLNPQNHFGGQYNRQERLIWELTHFFTPAELRLMLRDAFGDKPRILWQTTPPFWSGELPLLWGDLIGVAVKLY